MRPNLSVENIAGALAVLGTSVLMAACGGGDKPANTPVNATETPAAASGESKPADGHCGADTEHKGGDASCGAKPSDSVASEAKPADTSAAGTAPAPAAAADTKAAEATPADVKADAKKPADTKKPAAAAPAKKGGGASCGAGTCAVKK